MADTKTPPKEDKPKGLIGKLKDCLLYTSPSPRD